ncbi:hypothetical protein Naga_100150g13 [Nannochloropsis gaditana]|uniref:RAP domain-containing protein n=1 Tax=Nannochloropsis gaditana TaxID=72520 RepID=W7TR96_9STRA|nr:hypothetical protein Naga_100150g13 [Nannochloropsis gaditana]
MERGREGGGEGEKVWMVDFPKGWVVWEGGQEGGRAGPLLSYMRRLLTFPYRLHYRARSPAPLPALLAHGRAVVKDARPRELVRSLQALALLDRGRRAEGQDAFVKSCMTVALSTRFSKFQAGDIASLLESLLRLAAWQGYEPETVDTFLRVALARYMLVMEASSTQEIVLVLHILSCTPRAGAGGRRLEDLALSLLQRLLETPSLNEALKPQTAATLVSAAGRLFSSPSSAESSHRVKHLYRPLMLRACELLGEMDNQVGGREGGGKEGGRARGREGGREGGETRDSHNTLSGQLRRLCTLLGGKVSTGALRQGKNHAKTCRSRTEGNRKGNMGYQAHGTGEGGKGVDSVREDKERYPSLPCPFSNTIHPPQALARTVEGLGQLSHGRGGTREPIAGRFQTIASPSLSSFTSEELAASLQGLSLLGRSLSAEFSARAEAAILSHLDDCTLFQLVVALHSMATLGHRPGDHFLDAALAAVHSRLARPASIKKRPTSTSHPSSLKPFFPSLSPESELPKALPLLLVALGVLQHQPPSSLWLLLTDALVAGPDRIVPPKREKKLCSPPIPTPSLRLVDLAPCLWALATLDFPLSLPPSLLPSLLDRLDACLFTTENVALDTARQLKQFALAFDLSSPLSSSLPLWPALRTLIENHAWAPHAQEEYSRIDEEGEDRDNVITCPMQLEVVEILRELGFPCKSEVHWGPFSLDILIYPPSPPLGPVPAPAPSRSMALSHQTESQGQSDPSSSTSLPSLSSPGYTGPSSSLPFLPPSHHLSLPLVLEVDGRSHFLDTDSVTAPRGETVLKRKILAGMAGRLWAGVLVLTAEEWTACEEGNPALGYAPLDYTHNLQRRGEAERARKKQMLKERIKEAFLGPACVQGWTSGETWSHP